MDPNGNACCVTHKNATKKRCMFALDSSGTLFSPSHAFSVHLPTHYIYGETVCKHVICAYKLIAMQDRPVPDILSDIEHMSLNELLMMRNIMFESRFELKRPYDIEVPVGIVDCAINKLGCLSMYAPDGNIMTTGLIIADLRMHLLVKTVPIVEPVISIIRAYSDPSRDVPYLTCDNQEKTAKRVRHCPNCACRPPK